MRVHPVMHRARRRGVGRRRVRARAGTGLRAAPVPPHDGRAAHGRASRQRAHAANEGEPGLAHRPATLTSTQTTRYTCTPSLPASAARPLSPPLGSVSCRRKGFGHTTAGCAARTRAACVGRRLPAALVPTCPRANRCNAPRQDVQSARRANVQRAPQMRAVETASSEIAHGRLAGRHSAGTERIQRAGRHGPSVGRRRAAAGRAPVSTQRGRVHACTHLA
jgi:hypothetical protein